ncbi:nitroreductase/quinone reductase family protein [Pseudonocardia sp. NPDC046786]|uniref:nitroreductase/quinone reductase family protein n=1 Tax=Pseudonocardia sp. NPDC046786 TaxID=3155471 RepID=UPI0033D7295F
MDRTPDPRSRIRAPRELKEMNDELLAQREAGTLGFALPVLTVPGRRSGRPRRTPLTVYERDDARFVVGGFPAADWIANLRAAGGRATLSSGASTATEDVVLTELPIDEARPILAAWPEVTPDGVEIMVASGIAAAPTPEALADLAGTCPVFRVDPG